MGDLGLTAEGMTALLFSFSAGIAALAVLFMWSYPHNCGNRYCPHRKAKSDEEEDRRFWRQ